MAGDPLADMQNIIGYQGLVGPNPYLPYQGRIPFSTPDRSSGNYYVGQGGNQPPTDVYGNPLQSFVNNNAAQQSNYQNQLAAYNAQPASQAPPGQTINSNPINGGATDNGLTALNDMRNNIVAQNLSIQGDPAMRNQGGFGSGNNVLSNTASMQTRDNATALDQLNRQIAMAGQPATTGRGPPPTPPDMTQAYLSALSNPPIRSYGANPPQAGQTPTGSVQQPSVQQAFLASNPNASNPIFNPLRNRQATA